jgi:sortase A
MKRGLSYLFMLAGTALVFLGAREVLESHFGQTAAARNYAPAAPSSPRTAVQVGDTVAKLSIPRLNTQLYVIEGDDERQLRRGPGHMRGTPLPGARGNSVIAGHRDTHFRVLKDIRTGDDIVLDTPNGEFLYRVQATSIVSPSNTGSLKPSSEPLLHLITCYPFYYVGSAPKRLVVEARLAGQVTRVE